MRQPKSTLLTYSARYTQLDKGYMGQLVEWPEVVTEGATLDECRDMLRDALEQMIMAYRQLKQEIPRGSSLQEQITVEI